MSSIILIFFRLPRGYAWTIVLSMAEKQLTLEDFRNYGAQGGKTRASKLTPEQRRKSAQKAAKARWKKIRDIEKRLNKSSDKLNKSLDQVIKKAASSRVSTSRNKKIEKFLKIAKGE